ncbi:SusC/RagA family TonB-linked outer membrane protein [Fulvitalea axinellae]|uniref:SusC/RagA family TonB-linked outer membrane protein n=1 Tax=Fulvitalea axinellae TaxID=1182444 RepID=A0AAU9D5Z0_9BACT|nr:SusC/RagA family TonB-linked outer membrane protein [Fulvitalea axinellae]
MDHIKHQYRNLCLSVLLCLVTGFAFGQSNVTVTGTVLDARDGAPLAGVQVSVYGVAGASAETDSEGLFSVEADPSKNALQLTFADFETRLVYLNGRTSVSVGMRPEGFVGQSAPVEWVGGRRPGNDLPYAGTVIRKKELSNSGYVSLSQALAGLVPGLSGSQASGTPGVATTLNIRGVSSLNTNTQPLVVIDGVILENRLGELGAMGGPSLDPLTFLKVDNIESVTVIKDGGVALYGTLGANGVILVETQKSKATETRVDVESRFGVSFAPEKMPVMDAKQFQNYTMEQLTDQGWSYDRILSLYPFLVDKAEGSEYYRYANDTDWQDKVFQEGFNQSYSAFVQGGDAIANYAATAGYTQAEGIVKNSDFERFDFGMNADMNILKGLVVRPNVLFSRTSSRYLDESASRIANPLLASMSKSPMMKTFKSSDEGYPLPHYDGVGAFGVSNPQALIDNTLGEVESYRTVAGVDGNWVLMPGLDVYFNGGIDLLKYADDGFIPSQGVVPQQGGNAENSLLHLERSYFSTYFGGGFNFSKTFRGVHNLNARVGVRSKQNDFKSSFALDANSASDVFRKVGSGDKSLRSIQPGGGVWNTMTFESALNYVYLNKYILSGSLALDGNSRFDPDFRFGTFYSVAGAWRLSAEPFLAGIKNLDDLKIRASYGVSGNDDIGNMNSLYYYSSISYLNIGGLVRGGVPNSNLKWEETTTLNVGLDLSLISERFRLTLDYFESETDDLLGYQLLPTYYGLDTYASNSGSLKNSGFEIGFDAKMLETKRYDFSVGLVLSKYTNEMLSLPEGTESASNENGAGVNSVVTKVLGAESIMRVGEPINSFFGYETAGVFATAEEAKSAGLINEHKRPFGAGDMRFVDQDKNGIIDERDRVILGDPNPDFTGSFSLRGRYGRLSANVLFDFSYGGEIYNQTRRGLESMSDFGNQSTAVLKRWRADGDQTDIPRATLNDPMGNARFSDRWIEDGSFLRLRNITLNYALPLPKNKLVRGVDVHLTGQNLFTFSEYLGFTPDVTQGNVANRMGIDAGRFPLPRTVMAGLKIGI